MKKKIGYAMIIALFAGIFILGWILTSFLVTLGIFAATAFLAAFVSIAQYLIKS